MTINNQQILLFMKQTLLSLAALTMLLMTASCTKDVAAPEASGEGTVTFTAQLPYDISTKAFADGLTAKNLTYVVYFAGTTTQVTDGTATFNSSRDAMISLTLATGKSYDFVFWATADGAPYTFDKATQTVTVDYTGATANDEKRDAFFYTEKALAVDGPVSKNIRLFRPFAQLNIGTDDLTTAPVTETAVKVAVSKTLNLYDGTVDAPVEVTFAAAAKPAGTESFPVTGYDYLAMNYLLVGADKSLVDVTFTADGGTPKIYSSVPVQRNYRTNIYGSLLTSTANFTVTIRPYFEEPDYVAEISFVSGGTEQYATLAEAVQAASSGSTITLKGDIALIGNAAGAIVIDKEITLDLNGHNITTSIPDIATGTNQSVFNVKPGKSFTIKGSGNIASTFGKNVNSLSAVIFNQAGNVRIEGGNFTLSSPSSWMDALLPCIVDNSSNLGEANLTITGGTFTFNRNMIRSFCNSAESANITISGGVFNGGWIWQQDSPNIDMVNGQISITGGTFNNTAIDNELHSEDVTVSAGITVTVINDYDYVAKGVRRLATNEYEIVNGIGLAYASANLFTAGGTFKIGPSIDMNGITYTPAEVNNALTILPSNGSSATIKNLAVTSGTYSALIGRYSAKTLSIKNIIIDKANLTGTDDIDGEYSAAAFIGWLENHESGDSIVIEGCKVQNSILGPTKYVGGIVGYQSGTTPVTIKGCTVNLNKFYSNYQEGDIYKGHCGGVIGYLTGGSIPDGKVTNNTFTTTSSTGKVRIGVVVGSSQGGTVTYTAMTLTGNTNNGSEFTVLNGPEVNNATWN